jgi:polyhydroxyalkanoate synthesis regulator phasin
MARASQPKDIFARVQDLGEEALHKLAEAPGGARLLEMANQSRTRLDEVQKRLRGLDVLEERVDALERRLDALEKTAKPAAGKPAPAKPAAKKPAAKKPTT